MPIIFQHSISGEHQLAVWHITETAVFFQNRVLSPNNRSHPQALLRYLAARYLLGELMPDFPYGSIEISPSGKPELPGSHLHFSLSHCGDYAAAIISEKGSVGIDLEATSDRIFRIKHKFLSGTEQELLCQVVGAEQLHEGEEAANCLTLAWSAKESVYKWQGESGIDFIRDIALQESDRESGQLNFHFTPRKLDLKVNFLLLEKLVLTWIH